LFNKGKQYDKYFGDSRLKNIDISKIAINKVKGGGRTALGPALALAMGIISMHDQGSRIIVVTDSMPNFGILTTGDSDFIYKKIGSCLEENGATLSILKWSGDELDKSK
jgi:Mg-chelatase subunit ChlD